MLFLMQHQSNVSSRDWNRILVWQMCKPLHYAATKTKLLNGLMSFSLLSLNNRLYFIYKTSGRVKNKFKTSHIYNSMFCCALWCPTSPSSHHTLCSHHLKFYLNAQRLLLDGSYSCDEGFPHASSPAQRQLGNTFKASNRPGQNCGSTCAVHEQWADDLSVRDAVIQSVMFYNSSLQHQGTTTPAWWILTSASPVGGTQHW